jgi:hypothetical protein
MGLLDLGLDLVPGLLTLSASERIAATRPGNLIQFFRQNETAGAVASDSSAQGNDGAYTGVTLADGVGPDGQPVPLYDGSNDYLDAYSAGIAADFNPAAGTLLTWVQVSAAGVWSDGTLRFVVQYRADGDNRLYMAKTTNAGELQWLYEADNTAEIVTTAGHSDTEGFWMALTWDTAAGVDGEVKAYKNAVQQDVTKTALGTWVGALDATTAIWGAANTAAGAVWDGREGLSALWNVALTQAEIEGIVG